ncbi:AAA domain-containing protein [Paenibacillus cellulosilyticus]|uniref:AAA domain-containing protein n=1 Tax=Paenibacillus cellulosilyticus TaxID=375489 RepID=A0A2V2YC44_9BACL|nr:AAA domain-containing protein [Paenibacillus cellulosilyticus]
MSRFIIMTVGKTHSGKTTFATDLESVIQKAIVIDQDNHAEFINRYYKKLRPEEGPNTLKYSVTNTIVNYAVEQSGLHLVLSSSNLNKMEELKCLGIFMIKGLKVLLFILIYLVIYSRNVFNNPKEVTIYLEVPQAFWKY